MPEISVIMPIYNSEKTVTDAINSLLSQTFKDIEIIAINDGSKDNSSSVVSQINDERLVFVDDPINHGFVPTLNRCIDLAKGKYIARLDDDDIAYPTRLEKQYEYMELHSDVVLCGTHFDKIIDGQKKTIEIPPVTTDEQLAFSLIFDNLCIPHSSFMMRKKALLDNGIRYETYLQVPDYHMQTKLAEVGRIHFIREALVGYRIHASQSTAVRSTKMMMGEFDRARLWYVDRLMISDSDKRVLSRTITRRLQSVEDYKSFIDCAIMCSKKCGMTGSDEDNDCLSFIIKQEIKRQRKSFPVLIAYRYAKKCGIDLGRLGIKNTIKCILAFSPGYVKSDYDENDDGSIDKHSL